MKRKTELQAMVTELLAELQAMSVEALRSMPAYSEKSLISTVGSGGEVGVSYYRESSATSDCRIVIQACQVRCWGLLTYVVADGFEIGCDGLVRPLTEEELWPYH